MHMNKNDHLPIIITVLSALGGFIAGAVIGTILIILAVLLTDSTFRLNNIWPGPLIGAIVAAILGSFSPRIGKALWEILNYL